MDSHTTLSVALLLDLISFQVIFRNVHYRFPSTEICPENNEVQYDFAR